MSPIDVDATVIANRRLSRDYNVLTLAAPEVGARTIAGQFVMVRPAEMTETLLRRPFSVFEIIRDPAGRPTAISILNKRAGRTTNRLYETESGERIACLGPLGRPYTAVPGPTEAWMVAGGVGLAPFATLAEALASTRTPTTLFYGARSDRELFYLEFFERLGVTLVLTTEDGSRGERGRVTAPLDRALAGRSPGSIMVYALWPGTHAGRGGGHRRPPRPAVRGVRGTDHGLRPRRLLQLCDQGAPRRPAAFRPILYRRPGLRRRGHCLGLTVCPAISLFASGRFTSRTR